MFSDLVVWKFVKFEIVEFKNGFVWERQAPTNPRIRLSKCLKNWDMGLLSSRKHEIEHM